MQLKAKGRKAKVLTVAHFAVAVPQVLENAGSESGRPIFAFCFLPFAFCLLP
jgi:hypothetical protein